MKLSCFFIIALTVFSGCQELYQPEIDSDLSVLAVDGLLTDKPGPFIIHLQMARQFDSIGKGTPVSGAGVSVTNDLGQKYTFNETAYGNYVYDDSFFAVQPDRKYSLSIYATDGNQYESSAQELIPIKEIDKIYGRLTTKTYIRKNHYGETIRKDYEGIETFIDFLSDPGHFYAFKFSVTLLIEYTYNNGSTKYFAWRKFNMNENINITENKYEKENNAIVAHPLSFFPIEKSYYNLEVDFSDTNHKMIHWILIVDQFRLNENSYSFYKKIREQLAAEGKLFDPIAVQINGNIRCINNPQKLVLGNFEVSSKETVTYVVSPVWISNTATYRKIPNLLNIPDEGPGSDSPPDWWIN